VRRRPQALQPFLDRGRVGHRLVAGFLPGKFAAYRLHRALVGRDRLRAAAARRMFAL
jgi:hypothetical protein